MELQYFYSCLYQYLIVLIDHRMKTVAVYNISLWFTLN
jgi:hypothetical protein